MGERTNGRKDERTNERTDDLPNDNKYMDGVNGRRDWVHHTSFLWDFRPGHMEYLTTPAE